MIVAPVLVIVINADPLIHGSSFITSALKETEAESKESEEQKNRNLREDMIVVKVTDIRMDTKTDEKMDMKRKTEIEKKIDI